MAELTAVLIVAALLAVILIHWNLWRLFDEQKRHNRAVESLLADIRDRAGFGGPGPSAVPGRGA